MPNFNLGGINSLLRNLPLIPQQINNAASSGLANTRNTVGAAAGMGRGVANILGRAIAPSIQDIQGSFVNAGGALTNAVRPLGNTLGTAGKRLNPIMAALAVADQTPKAFDSAVSLYEAGEGLVRGGLNKEAQRQALIRMNQPGYQAFTSLGKIPPTDSTGESYRDAELRLSAAARAAGGPSAVGGIGGGNAASFIPYATGRGSDTPAPPAPPPLAAERAYREEVYRTAQLAAQNPEMQRYEAARKADLKTGDYGKSEDIGMEMWARANPTLAAKVKPGQAGYDVIQRVRGEAAQPGVGAFAATKPIFPGAQNYFGGQYQVTPGATTPNLSVFGIQQPLPSVPQNIGQFQYQAPMQPTATPLPTQGFGAAPGIDTIGAFDREQLSQDLLKKFAGLQK